MKYINQSTQTLLLGIPAVDKGYHRPNFATNLQMGGCFVCSSIAKINFLFFLGGLLRSRVLTMWKLFKQSRVSLKKCLCFSYTIRGTQLERKRSSSHKILLILK